MLPIQVLQQIQQQYNWTGAIQSYPLNNGLINHTWKVVSAKANYILQAINTHVFPQPEKIDQNLQLLAKHFSRGNKNYLFVGPVSTDDGKTMVCINDVYYRVFPFIEGTYTHNVLTKPEEAFEAARQFGKFTASLTHFNAQDLAITIPFFHHLSYRYWQFQHTWLCADEVLKKQARELANPISDQVHIVKKFNYFIHKNTCLQRTMHHDAKISNVLFNEAGKGVTVIDLDTVMSGYFFSDMGDMMRTYLSPVGEEEKDISLIEVRKDFLQAISEGYLTNMESVLTAFEKEHLLFSGQIITYMQALRFLTDFLQNNRYYACSYPQQNLVRTANQLQLLKQIQNHPTGKQQLYFLE